MNAQKPKFFDIIIIGAGPAGLAAAGEAIRCGAKSVLLLERNNKPGGILNQCIHDGFGIERFHTTLTGPEYLERFLPVLNLPGVTLKTDAMVLKLTPERLVTYACRTGLFTVQAGAVILATGCRERTRGAIGVAGTRPAGVYTAGVVQRLVNVENIMVGKRAVILGSGDIGLIMARRLTLEGAEIACVLEKLPYCSGLTRNMRQCLTDYEIPLELSTTVVELIGERRLTAVVAAKVDAFGELIPETRHVIPCDTLILSVGLIPENELAKACGVLINPQTGSALVDARLMTSIPGVFSCGNGLHVHDIVDMVSAEAEAAAQNAVRYLQAGSAEERQISLIAAAGIKYVLPPGIPENMSTTVALRVQAPGRMQTILVTQAEKVIAKKNMRRLSPAEMIRISLPPVSAENGHLSVSLTQEPVSADGAESSLICICCPNGCALFPEQGEDGTLQIKGALCPRGVNYAIGELNDPMRTLTTTVRIDNARYPLLPVRSKEPVKKGELPRLVKELRCVRLTTPIRCGEQIPFEGANIIASCTAATQEQQ